MGQAEVSAELYILDTLVHLLSTPKAQNIKGLWDESHNPLSYKRPEIHLNATHSATQKQKGLTAEAISPFITGRGERIWTSDPLLPKQVR